VLSAVVQPDGRFVAVGAFTEYNGVTQNRITRLLPNGGIDSSYAMGNGFDPQWTTNATSVWLAQLTPTNRLLTGGNFTMYGGTPAAAVARLNAGGGLDPSFTLDSALAPFSPVGLLVQDDDRTLLWQAGDASAQAVGRPRIVRVTAAGAVDNSFQLLGVAASESPGSVVMGDAGQLYFALGGRPEIFRTAAAVAPVIATPPTAQVVALGAAATLTVSASGVPAPTYQWYKDGAPVGGATDAALVIGTVALADAGNYTVVASNGLGSTTSAAAALVVGGVTVPVITTQPADVTVVSGQTATLSAAAVGTGTLTYQWRRNGFALPGASAPSYVLPGATRSAADFYDVVVSNAEGSVASRMARLSVAPTSYPGLVTRDEAWDLRPEVDGATVTAFLALPDGRTYVAGTMTSVNGQRRYGVFRLNADQTLDPTFVPPEIDGTVSALAVQPDGRLLIAGAFVRIYGIVRSRLARLNSDGSVDPSFNPAGTGPGSTVNSILVQADGQILIAGSFSTYNGVSRSGFAQLSSDGLLTNAPGVVVGGTAISLAPLAGGRVVIGGNFTAINGTPRPSVAVLKSDLTLDATFNPGSGNAGNVNIVIPQADGRVVIGGTFSAVNGTPRARLARLNADGSLDGAFDPGATFNGTVTSLGLASGDRIVVGSYYTPVNSTQPLGSVKRLNSDGSVDLSFADPSFSNMVNVVQVAADGRVLTGGAFITAGGLSQRGLARLSSAGTVDGALNLALRSGGSISAFALLPDGKALVAHSFQYLRGNPVPARLVRVNADGTIDATFNAGGSGANSTVSAIVRQPDGRILIAGSFGTYNGTAISRVARLNSDGTLDGTFTPPTFDNSIFDLALLPGGRMLVGGAFQTVGGSSRPWLAALQANGSVDPSVTLGLNGAVETFAVQPDGKVIVGGAFTPSSGSFGVRILRLNVDGTVDTTFNAGTALNNMPVDLIVQPDGRILAAGAFVQSSGAARNCLVRFEANGNVDASWSSPVTGVVTSFMRQEDGRILIRGLFTSINGVPSNQSLLRLNSDGTIDATFAAAGLSSINFIPSRLAMRDDGKILTGVSPALGFAAMRPAVLPAFVTPLTSQVVLAGSNVTFNAGAAVNVPATYQWTLNGVPIAGAYQSVLTLSNVTTQMAGAYAVTITCDFGAITSNTATLSVTPVTVDPIASRSVGLGGLTMFTAGTNAPGTLSYQWSRNATALPGKTTPTLIVSPVTTVDAGTYTVVITSSMAGSLTSSPATLTVLPNPIAYSARAMVSASGVFGAFSIEGTQPKRILLRVLGPTLANFGLSGVIADPVLAVSTAGGSVVAANDNWGDGNGASTLPTIFAQVGATALAAGSRDAALYLTLPPGSYTAQITGVGGGTGRALLEVYDVDTNPLSRIAYLGVRARLTAGDEPVVGGLTVTNSAEKRLLIRAVGPGLKTAGALPNPQLQVLDRNGLVAQNDDWAGATTVAAAEAQAGAFALAPASADAALLFAQRVGTDTYVAQLLGGTGGGNGLLEFYDIPPGGASNVAPVFVVSPTSVTLAAGGSGTLRAVAAGTAPLSYQWRKDGVVLAGASGPELDFAVAQAADAGVYDVMATSSLGGARSTAAIVGVGTNAAHAVVGGGYVPGGTATITNTLNYTGEASSLGWSVTLPAGWSFAGNAGAVAEIGPKAGDTGTLSWAWTAMPASPVVFTYTVNVPAGESAARTLPAQAIVRATEGTSTTLDAAPNPLTVTALLAHSADTNRDFRLSLLELTRVIELYNTRNGTSRTGCYRVEEGTEDGFAAEPARLGTTAVALSRYHSADSNHDGKLSLLELTRVIELYNYRVGTSRTGQYHPQASPVTEDGFAPGP
jgi:uncharacterized delta-60 repeat protein